jgi:hypothetical protein
MAVQIDYTQYEQGKNVKFDIGKIFIRAQKRCNSFKDDSQYISIKIG